MILSILSTTLKIIGEVLTLVTRIFEPNSTVAQISEYSPVAGLINFLKLVAYITTPILIVLIVWIAVKLSALLKTKQEAILLSSHKAGTEPASGGAMQTRWDEILKHIASTREGEWKFAIIEADKMVDDVLKSAGFPGETMGERLMSIERGQIQNLDGLWEAHKTRNRLVHDANYFLRYAEAKKAIQLYENTLKELGLL